MDHYNNPSPITPSVFSHCDPLKKSLGDFEKELIEENQKVDRQMQEDRKKKPDSQTTPHYKPTA